MNSHRLYRLLILLLVLTGGCGTPLPPTANPGRARSALQTALDAWQNGETVQSLQGRSPAIHVNDTAWDNGVRLVKYEIQSEQANGQGWKAQVLLTVQSGASAATQQQASYTIDTDPTVVIVRELE